MRTKLTALIVIGAALAAGAVAQAAPIPVASYQFQTQDDVNAFQKVAGAACKRKWVGIQALGIGVGRKHELVHLPLLGGRGLERPVLRSGDGRHDDRRRGDEEAA